MHEKELPPPLDAALSKVDPERRRLLGILLAGAATLPLLSSTTLGAQEKSATQSTNQNSRQTPIKHTPIDLKMSSDAIKSDTHIKGDSTVKMDSQIKGDRTIKMNSQIKGDSSQIKADSTIKSTIKSSSGAMKTDSAHIKGSSAPQQ